MNVAELEPRRVASIDPITYEVVVSAIDAARSLRMTLPELRLWRHRHPGQLDRVNTNNPHGMAIYRLEDVSRVVLTIRGATSTLG